jgi:hypothetical protein
MKWEHIEKRPGSEIGDPGTVVQTHPGTGIFPIRTLQQKDTIKSL